jgi:hypothetical protein
MSTEEVSRIASETWNIAEEDFRSFFLNYADEINRIVKKSVSRKFKQFKIKPTKHKCRTNSHQSSRSYPQKSTTPSCDSIIYVEQEEMMKRVYEKDVEEFKFVSF